MVRLIVWYVRALQWYGRRRRGQRFVSDVEEIRAALARVERGSPVVDYGKDVIVLDQRRPQLSRKHRQASR